MTDTPPGIFGIEPLDSQENIRHFIRSSQRQSKSPGIEEGFACS